MSSAAQTVWTYWPIGLLFVVAVGAWFLALGTKPFVRTPLRWACVMYLTWTIASVHPQLEAALRPMASTLALAFLALTVFGSFRRPVDIWVAGGLVAGAGLSGLAGALFGVYWPLVLSQIVSLATIFGVCRRGLMRLWPPSLQLLAGAASLTAALCTQVLPGIDGQNATALFSAAGFLGVTLAVVRISDTLTKHAAPHRRNRQGYNS